MAVHTRCPHWPLGRESFVLQICHQLETYQELSCTVATIHGQMGDLRPGTQIVSKRVLRALLTSSASYVYVLPHVINGMVCPTFKLAMVVSKPGESIHELRDQDSRH